MFWQSALDLGSAPIIRHQLNDRSWVDHAPGWLSGADDLLAGLLEALPWSQRRVQMFERELDEPRLTWWWSADRGPLPVDRLESIRQILSDRYGLTFDTVGCNLYRDGHDSVAWHADRIGRVAYEPLVAIVSLGQPRRFLLRPLGGGASRGFLLGNGDLLVMGGACQHDWQHAVPKVAHAGPRLSVTMRHLGGN